jgi:hypothetical protein
MAHYSWAVRAMREGAGIRGMLLQGLKPEREASLLSDPFEAQGKLKVRPPKEKSEERSPAARSPG